MKVFFLFIIFILSSPQAKADQIFESLIEELQKKADSHASGKLYFQNQFQYLFDIQRNSNLFSAKFYGPVLAEYTYDGKSQKGSLTLQNPEEDHKINVNDSSALKQTEWLLETLMQGMANVVQKSSFKTSRRLGNNSEILNVEFSSGPISSVQAEIYDSSSLREMLSFQAKDRMGREYLFLLD